MAYGKKSTQFCDPLKYFFLFNEIKQNTVS